MLAEAKYYGLSNQLIAHLWETTPEQVYQMAEDHQLMAKYKEIEPSGANLLSTRTVFTLPLRMKTRFERLRNLVRWLLAPAACGWV